MVSTTVVDCALTGRARAADGISISATAVRKYGLNNMRLSFASHDEVSIIWLIHLSWIANIFAIVLVFTLHVDATA